MLFVHQSCCMPLDSPNFVEVEICRQLKAQLLLGVQNIQFLWLLCRLYHKLLIITVRCSALHGLWDRNSVRLSVIYALSIGTKMNDLGWPWNDLGRQLCNSVALHTCVSEPTTIICMKIDPYCQRQKCSPGILVSNKIHFMQIFAGVRWRGASNESGVVEMVKNGDFRFFR